MKLIINKNQLTDNSEHTIWINNFKNCISPKVLGKIPIEEFLHKIKYGDENRLMIEVAREHGKGNKKYDKIKKSALPTFRFNFLIEGTANNVNVIRSTGLIYIDVDDYIEIPYNDYIYAKWRSLSNTGYGILVKVDNLTVANFQSAYTDIGRLLGVNIDNGARKPIQQTVLSYDPSLYHNSDSKIYHFDNSNKDKKVSLSGIKKERECIILNDTFTNYDGVRGKERGDNIDAYFTGENSEKDYLYFEDKVEICQPFIPWKGIEEGNRNNIMFSILSQLALLNPAFGKNYLSNKASLINQKMSPRLINTEINSIISSVLSMRKQGTLQMYYNKERKILFNPSKKLSGTERRKLSCEVLGAKKTEKTQQLIYEIIEKWNFDEFCKITKAKVILVSGLSKSTIYRHWHCFKDYVKVLNEDIKCDAA